MSLYELTEKMKLDLDQIVSNTGSSSGEMNVNLNQIHGNTVTFNSGSMNNGTQRVCLAYDDIPISDYICNSLFDNRYIQQYSYAMQIGGLNPTINALDWSCFPNANDGTGSPVLELDVIAPPNFNGFNEISTSSSHDHGSNTGAHELTINYRSTYNGNLTSSVNTLTNAITALSGGIFELGSMHVSAYTNDFENEGIIEITDGTAICGFMSNHSSKECPFYVQVPNLGYVFLEKLKVQSFETTDPTIGMRVKIFLVIYGPNSGSTSAPLIAQEVLFDCYCYPNSSQEFDLSSYKPIEQYPTWPISAGYRYLIVPAAMGQSHIDITGNPGSGGATVGAAYLNVKVSRARPAINPNPPSM